MALENQERWPQRFVEFNVDIKRCITRFPAFEQCRLIFYTINSEQYKSFIILEDLRRFFVVSQKNYNNHRNVNTNLKKILSKLKLCLWQFEVGLFNLELPKGCLQRCVDGIGQKNERLIIYQEQT